jgi:acetylglutamate kinase
MGVTVVKCGGAARVKERFVLERFAEPDVPTVVVHGAGTQISAALEAAGIESVFVGGRRVTSRSALPIVRAAYRLENAALCAELGPRALGLLGDEIGLRARRLRGLGHVGTLLPFVPHAVWDALHEGRVPVIAPLAPGPLNVNADDAASVLAVALGAERLVFHSDVPGVLVEGDLVARISEDDVGQLDAHVAGGMLPKLQAAVAAARAGIAVRVGETAIVA